ncbi:hypothetical protein [Microseira sp. BLCC-F43]|uniref:hypothetical protein n=1 Tax=Microseira sp. BLCC-F43 TaxID=3153602 RepID=UPI0035B9AC58
MTKVSVQENRVRASVAEAYRTVAASIGHCLNRYGCVLPISCHRYRENNKDC